MKIDSLKIYAKGLASGWAAILTSLFGMDSAALLSFSSENNLETWALVTWDIKKLETSEFFIYFRGLSLDSLMVLASWGPTFTK